MNSLDIRVVPTQPRYFAALERLQAIVFANIPADELFTAALYAQQIANFPDGQLTALAITDVGERVVGSTTTMRTRDIFDGDHPYYFDFIGQGTLDTHDPNGDWLYGIDVGVHPDFRRLGIGRQLYDARRDLVRRLNLRGELVAGLLPGYPACRAQMSVEDYVQRVVADELNDPTLSMQVKMGFRLRKLLYDYVDDPRSDGVVTLIERENPHYQPGV